mgnify:CR=1 FL=1
MISFPDLLEFDMEYIIEISSSLTDIIGIQKSIGAKNYFILFQFLFESVFLSLIGGGLGILLVYILSFTDLGTLDLKLSYYNILLGLGVSAIIGIISGVVV